MKQRYINRLNLGARLTLCFVAIVVLMLVEDCLLFWQFHAARSEANRLSGVSQELIAVVNFQATLLSFDDQIEVVARARDAQLLSAEAGPLRAMLLDSVRDAKNTVTHLPSEVQPYPTLLPTIEAIESSLPSQLDALTALGSAGDWDAVRLRLANEKKPLESQTSLLVRDINREVNEELEHTVANMNRFERQMLIALPLVATSTLLIAGLLGLLITRSITGPLRGVMAGSSALSRGEFDHQVSVTGDDELAKLGRVFNDMAARLRSLYETLQRKETYLSEAQRLAHCASWAWNPRGGEIFWSEEMFHILGYDPATTKPSWAVFLERVHPEDRPLIVHRAVMESTMEDWVDPGADYRVVLPDGKLKHLYSIAHVVSDDSGRQLEVIGTTIDVTETKQAEEKLRRSETFLAEGQRLSLTGSFSWKVATNEITWSEELYRIYEFEVGKPVTFDLIRTRVHPEDVSLIEKMRMVDKERDGGGDFEWHWRLMMPDHSIKYLHAVARATRDRDGQLEYIAAVQDVTARRTSEDALSKARSELAQVARVTSLGVLTASIAHEINQPLSGIITNASTCLRMLSADPPNVDGARETARRTIRDGNRASDVITRLRTLYSKKELQPESMDLNDAATEVISLSLSDLQRNRIVLHQEFADNLPLISADRIQLQQVILNLLRNASDAMKTVDDRARELLIRTEQDDSDWVRLSVKDAGVGFTSQAMDRLFEAFYTTKPDGMGIGLSVSRSIIEAHQGRLWAAANDGPGATFSFAIPCAVDSQAGSETQVQRTTPGT